MRLIEAPTLDVVPLAEMKAHLRVDADDDDALIASLTRGAVAYLDGWRGVLGWCLGAQTWAFSLPAFPAGGIDLPIGPAIEVTAITYTDAAGDPAEVDPADYELRVDGPCAQVRPVGSWPAGASDVEVTFRAGHEAAAEIHGTAPIIVKMIVAHWYENREAVAPGAMAKVPMAAQALIDAVRHRPL